MADTVVSEYKYENCLLVEGNDAEAPHAQELLTWIRRLFDLRSV